MPQTSPRTATDPVKNVHLRKGYNPDFVFTTTGDINYLVEVKGQDRLEDADVIPKRKGAADWARFVSDDGSCGE